LLLGLVSVGAYWASNTLSPSSHPARTVSEGTFANGLTRARAENGSTAAPAAGAQALNSATLPPTAAEAAHPLAPEAPVAATPPSPPAAEPTSAREHSPEPAAQRAMAPAASGAQAASPVLKDAPRIRMLPPGAAAATPAPGLSPAAAAAAPKAVRPPVRGSAAPSVAAGEAKGAPVSKTSDPNLSDKSKPAPSPSGGLEVTDFGGRE